VGDNGKFMCMVRYRGRDILLKIESKNHEVGVQIGQGVEKTRVRGTKGKVGLWPIRAF
jgi:hypothetical protein